MADNKNWATFLPKEEDADDWADFGGFETAQPITDPQASTTTGLISWAAMPTTPQITSNSSTGSSSQPHAGFHDNSQQQNPWATMFTSESTPSDQTPTETTNVEVEQHADITSSAFTQPADTSIALKDPEPAVMSNALKDPELAVLSDNSIINNIGTNGQSNDYSKEIKEQREKTERAENLTSELENKLSVAEQEKIEFKQDLQDQMNKNEHLEEESTTTKQTLEEQRLKYSQLQDDHQKQISEIRQAGHDALAIIIEEYKELCKQAVIEQKEKSQTEFKLFLENEQQKFKETLMQQQESFEKMLSEERASNDERIKSVLQAEQEKRKLLLASSLKSAQEESKTAMQSAVKETIQQGHESVKEAVDKEKETHQKAMEEMEKLLQEEREKFKLTLEETINEERNHSKIAIKEALVEERSRSRDAISKSIEETKVIMNDYTQTKLEAESKIRQKQFMAIELFLESARTQIKSLMEG